MVTLQHFVFYRGSHSTNEQLSGHLLAHLFPTVWGVPSASHLTLRGRRLGYSFGSDEVGHNLSQDAYRKQSFGCRLQNQVILGSNY